ncbi:type II toxin-antitoxin system PemK/MazF family toxin [Microbacterium sp. CFH 90308]|uniref:Type II toxin-antitoxin system PemK/MazF family toxin n=1 Tax=Microbacterium salsuginis TaxID=2722803 RepID=A0ABX1K734_9MICO|nr:type II toxin-antitoxin system PemK/MazF family toxin [Microbacterium sp. CFH 90308]NLP82829.1 type II toxin-antitoxin system PemK/MazF family toxin [Microbacterium sp. CFH 90308]
MLNDPGHPRHDAVRTRIQQTVGPWGSYDPDVFDLGAAQRSLEQSFVTERASARETGILASVVNDLPRLARTGLRAHLEACALDLPVVVTADEAGWPNHVRVDGPSGLDRPSWVMTEQPRTLARERLTRVSGRVDESCLREVRMWLRDFLDI